MNLKITQIHVNVAADAASLPGFSAHRTPSCTSTTMQVGSSRYPPPIGPVSSASATTMYPLAMSYYTRQDQAR